MAVRVPANAAMAGIQAGIFNYDRPIIRKLAADRCAEANVPTAARALTPGVAVATRTPTTLRGG